jgi:hypothetical protein
VKLKVGLKDKKLGTKINGRCNDITNAEANKKCHFKAFI